jgi:2-polyprenyl-3-methyl-5-hydroxy-6-metoxy-1,4-benzoquinol methylase
VTSKDHWESMYASKGDVEVSWTQTDPAVSLALIQEICPSGRVIDIGGGTSALAGRLLGSGYAVAVVDISETAIRRARKQLGAMAEQIQWIAADATAVRDLGRFDVWHDRAVFHFLTDPEDRAAYLTLLARTVRAGGHAVIATFSPEGPERCSGLEVRRYSGEMLAKEFGMTWSLLKSVPETHVTPWGKPQAFQYSVFWRSTG